ncbi:MAG: ATP-binding protein [Actinomycetota bacterium]
MGNEPSARERRDLVRILIADGKPEARALLRRIIDGDRRFAVVAEAATGLEVVERIDTARPDAVIIDLAMPEMSGPETIAVIAQRAPDARILALTEPLSPGLEEELKRKGAHQSFEKGGAVTALFSRLEALFPHLPPEETVPQPEAARNIDDVLSLLVHEVQAPLTVIEGFALTLGRAVERGDDAVIDETAQAIRRATGTLRALIRSFAEVGAMEAGRLSLNLREAQLVQLVRLTVDDLATGVGSHTIIVDAGDNFTAQVDSVRIRQVITNLITNAVKFSPRRTEITIRVRRERELAHISVENRGPGIPAGRRAELFQKFSRLGASGAGMGLGLYLSRGIARAHNGDLTCESTGRGTTFTLSLPLEHEGDPGT